jgi:hypothetical protein
MEEVVVLDDDRRSLLCRQPVAGSGTVRILVNDEFFLPQGGLFSSAILRATGSGPYDILEGEDTLTVTTSAGTQTVSFGVTNIVTRFTAAEIVTFLSKQSFTMADAAAENGHLVFMDVTKVGPDSYVKVSGTAAGALGFGSPAANGVPANYRQWASRGVQLYPPWRLNVRPDEITNRFPKFDAPVQSNPIFKVTYTVPPERCLRCGNIGNENDYRFDQSGQFIMIENEDLLYQAALKIVLTTKGSNPYYPWYGTSIQSRIGSKAVSGVATLINEDIRKALIKFQDLQKEQGKFQKVTFKERLFSILAVQTRPHAQDPTIFLVDVTLQNASSEPINLNIVFATPGVVALMGSNGRFLNSN